MDPRSILFSSVLIFLILARNVSGGVMCNNQCCRFVEGFPVRLRKLREDFSQIRDYYEANDDLDAALLDDTVEHSFKSPFACQAMDNILGFYLRTVLPTAMAGPTEDIKALKPYMESIQVIFNELKREITKCRNYFSCKKPFDISNLNSTYTQMQSNGLYKAMGELDILFNYIERYLASNRNRTPAASV